ncbi:nineteen complex-related protein 2-domain-containing protein [Cercophora scortea]|uniref:Nineteen complex-related protein 2-domain-containing protein n=1 Tax=Cercophora scortea TaxID=314031 RepID=A0AAE0J1J9_9PEZI|nr:nineteen complex-related protein 2-domain-containing protein [Cercophora scortea]
MSSFGTKRKARIIQTLDDEDADLGPSLIGGEEAKKDAPPQGPIKFGRSKPAKSSSLRKSINFNDDDDDTTTAQPNNGDTAPPTSADDDVSAPVVIRPSLSRSGSTKQKKGQSSSRLSFGPSEIGADADADDSTNAPSASLSTPKKNLGKRALENNALRRSSSLQNLATRFAGGDEERPRYSKEYLEELQSSTPNTPQNLSSLRITDDAGNDDLMDLDAAELDGALVVPAPAASLALTQGAPAAAHVLTDTEIRERKERRARLAKEAEFISLSGSDSDSPRDSRVTVDFSKTKTTTSTKRSESRLIAEDEDLGEGYDEFVQDGGLALGRQASSAAAKRQRQQIAELINTAEANSDAESDDSEAERRAAYEAAQRRAGMDGLQRLGDDEDDDEIGLNAIPRMKPLPELDDVLQRMRGLVQGLEDDVARKRARIADLQREKDEILQREREVQEILNQAGAKYKEVMGASAGAGVVAAGGVGDAIKMAAAAQSPLRPLPPGIAVGEHLPIERGLESFGTTPTTRPDLEDMV